MIFTTKPQFCPETFHQTTRPHIPRNRYLRNHYRTVHPMPTYNIIGDIHGRDTWKRLVDDNCVNVFVGDYFDPYLDFTIEELERNFMEIVEYKRKHRKNTVLLYGNHDMDYLPDIPNTTAASTRKTLSGYSSCSPPPNGCSTVSLTP